MVDWAVPRVEVEEEEERAAFEDERLVGDVGVEEVRRVGEEGWGAEGGEHGLIEVAEGAEFEERVVAQRPLTAGVVAGPCVAFAWEVDPFRVAEFVAHEVEVAVASGGEGEEAGDFGEGDAAVGVGVRVGAGHAVVDGGVEETEEEGFAADDGLVVAFDVGDDLFFRAAGGEFVVEVFDVPVFVFDFGGETGPDVGDTHGEAEVEACAACGAWTDETGHATDVFGDGEGGGVEGMDEIVGEGEVGEGVFVDGGIEVILVGREDLAETVVHVEHGGDPVEAEAVEVEFLDPVAGVREEEVEDGRFGVVEAAGVPCGVEAAWAVVEVLVGGAVEVGEPFDFVFDGVGVDEVDDDGEAERVGGVDEGFEFFRGAEA